MLRSKAMRNKRGFTLIELLIVVVIIGILAALAIPKFSKTREKAYVAAMTADLKNLSTYQELYFSDHYTYTSDKEALRFVETKSVTVAITANATGWSATASHSALPDTCAVGYGELGDGTIRCTGDVVVEPEG